MMQAAAPDFDQLVQEHHALLRAYGEAQQRCTDALMHQAREIARLEAEAVRLRARVILRTSELAWAREDRAALEQSIPGLGKRVNLARQVQALQARVRALMDERERPRAMRPAMPPVTASGDDYAHLEADLAGADLVICQTGCISHGAYWRVQDHCQRTGKACVLVEDPAALRIVRVHDAVPGPG